MDGVIFDSETMYINELITFFKIHHIDISINDCKRIIGVDHHKFRSIVYNFWQNKTSKEEFEYQPDYPQLFVPDFDQFQNFYLLKLLHLPLH